MPRIRTMHPAHLRLISRLRKRNPNLDVEPRLPEPLLPVISVVLRVKVDTAHSF